MAKPRILPLVATCTVLSASAAWGEPQSAPAHPAITRVVLVGAHWCAPCRAELPELGALASAAHPARLALAWIDRKPVLTAPASGLVEVLSVSAAQDLVARHAAAGRGVPFAVAYGADGKPCTVWRGPLKSADWPKLEQACGAPHSTTGSAI